MHLAKLAIPVEFKFLFLNQQNITPKILHLGISPCGGGEKILLTCIIDGILIGISSSGVV
jgi:hypothetical protein